MELSTYQKDLQILIAVAAGFVLTFLPSLLGILLLTRTIQGEAHFLGRRPRSPRWLIILLGLVCQVPAILYVLSLLHTEAFHIILRATR